MQNMFLKIYFLLFTYAFYYYNPLYVEIIKYCVAHFMWFAK